MRPINADALKIDSWKTLEDAIFDITHAPTMELSMRKYEKCMHYDTCKDSSVTMCGKRWSDEGCTKEVPPSNADHIRSMTDEELAEMIGMKSLCGYIQDNFYELCETTSVCKGCVERWLKEPYKEKE